MYVTRAIFITFIALSTQQIYIISERGISGISIISTIWLCLFLVCAIMACLKILKVRFKISLEKYSNLKLLIWVSGLLLLLTESILRYGLKYNLVYNETNGDFYYESFYQEDYGDHYLYSKNSATEYITNEFQYYRKTNSLGIVNEEVSVEKSDNEYRILCLGDSFTEGIGAVKEIESYPRVLERLLRERYGRKITVINSGIAGSDPVFQLKILKDIFLSYNPDLVIVATNTVDIDEIMVRGGEDRFDKKRSRNALAPWWEPLYASSFIYRFLIHNVLRKNYLFLNSQEDFNKKKDALMQVSEVFGSFHKLSIDNNFKFMTVFHPSSGEEVRNGQYSIDNFVNEVSMNKDVIKIDLLNYYQTVMKMNAQNYLDYYWEKDLHHNKKGYIAFSQAVFEEINKKNLISNSLAETE